MPPVSRVAKITGREVLRLTNSVVRRYLSETFAVSNVSLFVLSLSLSLLSKSFESVSRGKALSLPKKKKKEKSRNENWIERSIENLAWFPTLYATRPIFPLLVEKLVAKKRGGNVATLCARVDGE